MASELITDWAKYDHSLRSILVVALKTLDIFDEDLLNLRIERPDIIELLHRFLRTNKAARLRIAIRNAESFRRHSPRLMKLLATYSQNMTVAECPPHLTSLNDSMVIVDDRHALIRFHKDNVRSKIIIDDLQECSPHAHRFGEILAEGGEQISPTKLGL